MASTIGTDQPGNDTYQTDHMRLIFKEGLSFSGFERDFLYLNMAGKKFQDISGVSGIDSISDGRAAVVADFDNDGDSDIFLTTIQGQGHQLFRNNVGEKNNFIRISLEGTRSGKDAFGTVVRLKTTQGLMTRIKSGGNGFLAQHDPRLLFGLGRQNEIQSIEITWPSGKIQKFGPVEVNCSLKIIEDNDQVQIVAEKSGRLPDPLSKDDVLWSKLKIKKGQPLPPLLLYSLEKKVRMKTSFPSTKSHLLNFWATWCSPCLKEMPELQRLLPQFRASQIELVGISLDQDVKLEEVQKFAQRLGISYPLYVIDEQDMGLIFGEEVFVPLSILVDDLGRVVEVFAGWNTESERRIHKLLKSRPDPES